MRYFFTAACIILPVSQVTISFAQDPQGGGAGPGGGTGGAAQPPPTVQYYPGGVAPTPAGKPLGGGNVSGSSSMPKTGDETDSYDLKSGRGGSTGTSFGRPEGYADLGGEGSGTIHLGGEGGSSSSDIHTVRKGDTLWGICDYYFRNPYQWPRVWSYNPQIQNPHWIYPGDLVKLRSGAQTPIGDVVQPQGQQSMVDRRRQVVPDTIFLRDVGFIDDSDKDNWGEVAGAAVDKMFLTDTDEIYVRLGPDHDAKVGQELTIFRPLRAVKGGRLVQIQGTVRVDGWDPKTHIARGKIVETLDIIERGSRIGPIGRKFTVVPPQRNENEIKANIIASIYPHNFYGQNQVVFIDKGADDGLKPGNRMFVIRRGDDWRSSLASEAAGTRIALESDDPAETEKYPRYTNSSFPEEVIGEIRILVTKPHNSVCLVTRSTHEIERTDQAFMRKGY
jgi:hypothetical protein